jgi:hypothetical protein
MHAEHAHVERMVGGKYRQTEEGGAERQVGLLYHLTELFLCVRQLYTMTSQN